MITTSFNDFNKNSNDCSFKIYVHQVWSDVKKIQQEPSQSSSYAPIFLKIQGIEGYYALSISEAEHFEMAEAVKGVRVITQMSQPIGFGFKKPMIVHVDNLVARFMSQNASATNRTRHGDACQHHSIVKNICYSQRISTVTYYMITHIKRTMSQKI